MQTNNNQKPKKEPKVYTDYNIFPGKVRLVGGDGQTSVVERDWAIEQAKSENKNLVQIGYNKMDFPHSICKIMDYGKFLYDQNKKQKLAKKTERMNRVDLKEIFFSIRIDENDMNTKINHAREFILDGDKVKVVVKLMRREMSKSEFGKMVLKQVIDSLSDVSVVDTPISSMGNLISCVLKKK